MKVDNTIFFAAIEEQLAEGRRIRLTLVGSSMEPSIHNGEPIVIAPADGTECTGDVVLFRYTGGHRLHRIISIDGSLVTFQGDNCYTREQCSRSDIVAKVVEVPRIGITDSDAWRKVSRYALRRKALKNFGIRWLGREGRRQLRPWYFVLLAILMWAPLNGIGIPLNNYIFGLRADHLLHASVFIPCTLFLMDIIGPRWLVWLMAVGIGLLAECVQWLLPWRGFDINDMAANAIGVTLGWLVVRSAASLLRRGRRSGCRQRRGRTQA